MLGLSSDKSGKTSKSTAKNMSAHTIFPILTSHEEIRSILFSHLKLVGFVLKIESPWEIQKIGIKYIFLVGKTIATAIKCNYFGVTGKVRNNNYCIVERNYSI